MENVKYSVVNMGGKEVGSIDLDGSVFGAPVNESLVHQTVRWQLAKRRAGTHSTLSRSDMWASGAKPVKQKKTGRARAGSFVSPLWVGGAVVFGPKPRSYDFRLTKRTRRQALAAVLSEKTSTKMLRIVDEITMKTPRTGEFVEMLGKIGASDGGVAIVLGDKNEIVMKSLRNIPKVTLLPAAGVNVYDLLRHKYLVATKEGIKALEGRVLQTEGEQVTEVKAAPKAKAVRAKAVKKAE